MLYVCLVYSCYWYFFFFSAEATDHFLNENIDTIIEDLIEPVEDTITEIITDIAKKFYDEFPLNVLYDL